MTSNPLSFFIRAHKWLIRKGAENRDASILGKLQNAGSKSLQSLENTNPVVFFNASTRLEGISLNSAFSILTNISLKIQRVKTIQWVCNRGMSHCVLGTDRHNLKKPPPCDVCIAQSRRTFRNADIEEFSFQPDIGLSDKLAKMSFAELSSFEHKGLPLGSIVIPSLRWTLRKLNIENNAEHTDLLREYILSAENIKRQFTRLLENTHPKAVVLFNGQFYPEAIVKQIAKRNGIRVITHEVALRPLSAFFTEGEATAYPINIPDGYKLNPHQEKLLDEYLQQRFQGDFSMAGIRFWPSMKGLDNDFLRKVKKFKHIVPIFTNVVFDTSQGHANILFTDMYEWLDTIHQLIKKNPETFFIIRAHPDEGRPGKESRESVAQWVKVNGVDQLPNVKFVDFNEYFSSYELIGKSKFVMVYNSTIGLEASILGAMVLCGGKARYTQYPSVLLPKSKSEFVEKAVELLNAKVIKPPVEYKQNARIFLYFQLFRTSLSFADFLKSDPEWRGFVHLKDFASNRLNPTTNPLFKTLSEGILNGQPFLVDDIAASMEEYLE
jgi:hypothetical protein